MVQKRTTVWALPSMGLCDLGQLRTLLHISLGIYMIDPPPILLDSLENQILKCIKKLSTKHTSLKVRNINSQQKNPCSKA